jgi:hypothetical protein
MATALSVKYCGTIFASTRDVSDDTSDGFITTAFPAAMAPAAGMSNN